MFQEKRAPRENLTASPLDVRLHRGYSNIMTTNREASFHLRTGYLRTACGTHRAQSYVERARFEALPVEHRCVKCDAKLATTKARETAKATQS